MKVTSGSALRLFLLCFYCFGIVGLAAGQDLPPARVETQLDNPAAFSVQLGHRQLAERELSVLMSSHPLETQIPQARRLVLGASEVEERIGELVVAESASLAQKRGSVSAVQLIQSASPYDIGDWVDQADGSRAYRLDLSVEGATAIGFILDIGVVPSRAVAFAYAPESDAGAVHRGPALFIPRPDGKPMYVVPINEERVVLEIHHLPRDYGTDPAQPPPFKISVVVRTPALATQVPLVADVGNYVGPTGNCVAQKDLMGDSRATRVERGVVGAEVCGSAFCRYCSAALLKDSEAQTDIPYMLTAGHCDVANGTAVSLHFRYETTDSTSDETNSVHEEISPPLFRLDGEWTNQGEPNCSLPDWALLRFNLASELTHAPNFLRGTNAVPDSFETVFTAHRAGGGTKQFAEGEIASSQTGDESSSVVALNRLGSIEAGSDGAPWFDAGGDRIWGVHNCGGDCSGTSAVTATRYGHVSRRIGKFLTPRLAQPQITDVSPVGRIKLGDEIVLRIDARNAGAYASPDGHINVAFPSFKQPADALFVSDSAMSPGLTYIERPAGVTMDARDGSLPPMSYLHVQAVDSDWVPDESNFLELAIEPQQPGTFEILYRVAARSENLYYYNDPVDELAEGMDLDQGWGVRRLVIQVDDPNGVVCQSSECQDGQARFKGATPAAELSLSSGSSSRGSTVVLQMSLAGGALPAGLQWRMEYSDLELAFEHATVGPVAAAANKSIQCAPSVDLTNCIVFGGAETIADGVVANLTFSVVPTTSASSANVALSTMSATSPGGMGIAISGTGGTVSVGPCPSNLVLADQTVSGVQFLQATTSAILGANLIIDGANVVVSAPVVEILGGTSISGAFGIGTSTACP